MNLTCKTTKKNGNKHKKNASNRPSTFKLFSKATTSKIGFPAKISKNNFANAIDEIANYIFDNRNDEIELTKELVLLEANLSDSQFLDNIDASLRETLSQFRTIVISALTSIVSIDFCLNYGINPPLILATCVLLLVLYFFLNFACTLIKGQNSKIFDTKFKKAIEMTISNIVEREKTAKYTITKEEIKNMICTNMAILQHQ